MCTQYICVYVCECVCVCIQPHESQPQPPQTRQKPQPLPQYSHTWGGGVQGGGTQGYYIITIKWFPTRKFTGASTHPPPTPRPPSPRSQPRGGGTLSHVYSNGDQNARLKCSISPLASDVIVYSGIYNEIWAQRGDPPQSDPHGAIGRNKELYFRVGVLFKIGSKQKQAKASKGKQKQTKASKSKPKPPNM